jgi:hypothetical protein
MFLPVIRLREKHYCVDLEGFPRYLFYGVKLSGYVLGPVGIAGLLSRAF